jgi:hypothetical protein
MEELPHIAPSPGDIVMIAKKFMADPLPSKVCILMSAEGAAALRLGFQQPCGAAARRVIPEPVVKNVATYAPRCAQQGIISEEASNYLLAWSNNALPKEPRPLVYNFLKYRQGTPFAYLGHLVVPSWSVRNRVRHIAVCEAVADAADSASEDDAVVAFDE